MKFLKFSALLLWVIFISNTAFQQAVVKDSKDSEKKRNIIEGCQLFPTNNIWNTPIDTLPVDANSSLYIDTIGANEPVHADFGSGLWDGGPIGIPYTTVPGTQQKVTVTFAYADESDPGPYPVPPDAPIEGGPNSTGDRHVLVVDRENCILYELFYAFPQPDGSWHAGSGAIFHLNSQDLRPAGWTSADAAGLPILPGLIRYEEVAAGEIDHALRFTAPQTRRAYTWPGRHYASALTGAQYPPMGQRFRLKAGVDISGFSAPVQVILRALKKYGMFLADNGSSWFISGVPDERWDNDVLHELHNLSGSDFEAVDESSLTIDPDSGEALQNGGQKEITVTAPNGSENWQRGSTKNITWTASGLTGNIKITLWQNGVLIGVIANNVNPAAGIYSWTVGQHSSGFAPANGGYAVKIKEKGTAVADTGAAAFTIVELTLTTPNGGESRQAGSTKDITWTAYGLSANVKITLWQNGVLIGTIANDVNPATGAYSWTVGLHNGGFAPAGSGYTIKIKEKGTAVVDTSNASFSIAAFLALTAPNGGESWPLGAARNITWTAYGLSGNIKITLWQNGVLIGVIANNVNPASGVYPWTVGGYSGGFAPAGGGYTIKIKERGTAVADTGDAFFTLSN
ncbi:MAG: hypothetical protein KAW12_02435 [Candidatus Aminicenantes bacterium]|nr:hypothetical protein [Candidatus Aminicenantes bacterium]